MTAHQIVKRLLAGEREITLRYADERSAIDLYGQIQRVISGLGLGDVLPDVCVRLGPERAIVSWGG